MSDEINNVFLFVADSLRWDYLPDQIASKGTVFKTVAAGSKTVHTFPTLATGLYPQEYGIESWGDTLPEDVDSIYDVESLNAGFYSAGMTAEILPSILGAEEMTELSELDPPFFYIERDSSPHVPHAGYDNHQQYLADRVGNLDQMRADYRETIEDSKAIFEERLQELENRNLLDETLVIYTSDHGELFGEYGELLHSSPLCPELVYVPAVFINPSLSGEDFYVDASTEIIEQVDMIKTAFSLLGEPLQGVEGTDILSESRDRAYGHSFANISHRGITFYRANSIWWYDSGYVFAENRRIERFLYPFAYSLKAANRKHIRRNLPQLLRYYPKSSHTFGNPPMEKSEAETALNELLSDLNERTSVKMELDEQAKEILEDLGYHPE